jgi:hypothetical protein
MILPDLKNLITIDELARRYPTILSIRSVRWWIIDRKNNNLQESGAIIKISRKLYIDETKFIDWLHKHKMKM